MDYKRIYENLIERAKNEVRQKGCGVYYESHHILPRSLGGEDCDTNLVLLTWREHVLAHKLLCKFIEDVSHLRKMRYALNRMISGAGANRVRKTATDPLPLLSDTKDPKFRASTAFLAMSKIVPFSTRKQVATAGILLTLLGEAHPLAMVCRLRANNCPIGVGALKSTVRLLKLHGYISVNIGYSNGNAGVPSTIQLTEKGIALDKTFNSFSKTRMSRSDVALHIEFYNQVLQ